MAVRRCVIVPVLCGMLAAAPAMAGDAGARERELQARRAQLQQKWERQFRQADTDDSRGLTVTEIETAGLPASLIRRFADIDHDADGALSPEELMAAQRQRLRTATQPAPP